MTATGSGDYLPTRRRLVERNPSPDIAAIRTEIGGVEVWEGRASCVSVGICQADLWNFTIPEIAAIGPEVLLHWLVSQNTFERSDAWCKPGI